MNFPKKGGSGNWRRTPRGQRRGAPSDTHPTDPIAPRFLPTSRLSSFGDAPFCKSWSSSTRHPSHPFHVFRAIAPPNPSITSSLPIGAYFQKPHSQLPLCLCDPHPVCITAVSELRVVY
ncbi:hypothetical protein KC19_10G085400 [Ceratodon purpureus]|uniref:Uncharacterized protein n=1 Tax=Ceratodon purpureus TaxID=3225 RepID=A0A8T0GN64_CERPU|nr:hypothetical protein KC19_10G085400 [Ceratodon purpureus]